MIEMEEDAISHALGLNYGIIYECIIEYLVLRNHYHMLCNNLGCSVFSGLSGNEPDFFSRLSYMSSSCAPEISLPH